MKAFGPIVDYVVMAIGVKTDDRLIEQLEKCACDVVMVGDANKVKNGYQGIREAYETALNIK